MRNKKKSSEKLVFTIIILIFAFSTVLAYSSISLKAPSAPPLTTPEAQKEEKIMKDLLSKGLNPEQNLTGVIRRLDAGLYSEGAHYLEAGGITLAILEADSGVNLDKYIGKNVKVWGDSRMIAEGDGAIMKVKRVEVNP